MMERKKKGEVKDDGDFAPIQEDGIRGILGHRPSTASKLPRGLQQVFASFWVSVATSVH